MQFMQEVGLAMQKDISVKQVVLLIEWRKII
jgi:hypothetical protein